MRRMVISKKKIIVFFFLLLLFSQIVSLNIYASPLNSKKSLKSTSFSDKSENSSVFERLNLHGFSNKMIGVEEYSISSEREAGIKVYESIGNNVLK
ncbi:hypothetical protein J7L49_00260, partial [Candidatus Bathyarchaeota archaeon]|nr:hypothetical protein [Candidatus Bathyarchaeota archaeon]